MFCWCWLGCHRYRQACLSDGYTYPALWLVCERCGHVPAFPFDDYMVHPMRRCLDWFREGEED